VTAPTTMRATLATLLAFALVAPAADAQAPARPPAPARIDTTVAPASLGHAFALAGAAYAAGEHREVRRVLRAAAAFAPSDGTVLLHLARAEALTGRGDSALAVLERLAPQGAVRDFAADSAFAALKDDPRFQAVVRRLAANAAPLVRSDTAVVLPDPDFIPEGIARDPADSAIYVGSLHRGEIVRAAGGGRFTIFARMEEGGRRQVLGLRVDSRARRLWAATILLDSAAPAFRRGPGGWSALHAYDLATGRLVARHAPSDSAAGPHLFNDIAVTPAGDVYVTDSEGGALWRLPAGGGALERVYGGSPRFTYPNGVAVGAGGRRLYVAHVEGLSTVELAGREAGRARPLPAPAGVPTGGIDGLYACGDALLAVQGMVGYDQVSWIELAPDGRRVRALRALERAHPAHDAATTGAPSADAFYYIANSQLPRLGQDGTLTPAPRPRPSVVLRLPLPRRCEGGR